MLEWMICRTVRDKFRALSMEKSDKAMPVDVEGDPMIVQTTTTTSVTSAKSNAKAKAGTNGVMIKIFANSLFELYTTKLRHNGVETFLVASMLFNGFAVADMLGSTSDCVVYAQSTFLAVNVLLLISAKLLGRFVGLSRVSFGVSLMALTVGVAQFWVHFYYYPLLTPRLGLVWISNIIFLANVSLPVGQIFAFLASCLLFISYLAVRMTTGMPVFLGGSQGLSIILHLMTVMVIGFASNWLTMREHERAYNEAKQSLEVKMVIEEQSAEQERLLLSVLPEHVAVQMRQDLGADADEQFKKIYMSRHENVSILYADIVGFTAISSTYSAQDLVKMLNELFARFDRLAEKYHQLRIKILGDCYYCISGAPVERPDHAALCVHMGLSMVKAIKYVQQKTNSPVDMRVGIHTGAILAGILGQRQWQFDVYSRDVELANKMESSGLAGRVHISEKTLGYLKGEFEVEPAFGEKREESLRIAGLKTYFIKKVLIPFQRDADAPNAGNGAARPAADGNGVIVGVPKSVTLESIDADQSSDVSRAPSTENGGPSMTVALEQCAQINMEDDLEFSERLRHELLDRDRHRELHDELFRWHRFSKLEVEEAYAKYCEPLRLLPYVALFVVTCINSLIMSCILPLNSWRFKLIFIIPAIMLSLLMVLLPEAVMFLYRNRRSWKDILTKDCNHAGHLIVRGIVLISVAFPLHYWWGYSLDGVPEHFFINPNETHIGPEFRDRNLERFKLDNYYAVWDDFHAATGLLMMICIALMSNISHLARAALLLYANVLYQYGNVYIKDRFAFDLQNAQPGVAWCVTVLSLPLCLLARHNEMTDRVLFRWKTEVIEQKERASDMRRRNEALVYNILPVHVAEHFMSNKHRSYDDLYSQSYDEVGVLFASMPNFSDFYSEDTVNNQGLECLRFLNEVISDFDALLGVPRFQDVIKIKTIGSTYMAASGLNPSRQVRPEDPVDVRWEHLSLLVDFALELKKALQCINEQSFNHFVLKMGINHGPITAGVIGARKPHYDIWGNTVNVASRMESTGKAGAIQVTEETCHILQTFGYTFEQRGLVAVKGKGQLMTYYLQGRTVPKPVSSGAYSTSQTNPLETLAEVDESRDNSSMGQPESPLLAAKALKSPSLRKASRAPAKVEDTAAAVANNHVNDPDTSTSSTPLLAQSGEKTVGDAGEQDALIGNNAMKQ